MEQKDRKKYTSHEKTVMAMEGVTNMYHRMVDTCFKKCTGYRIHHLENTIGSGEGHCLDRCMLKYIETQTITGIRLRRHGLNLT